MLSTDVQLYMEKFQLGLKFVLEVMSKIVLVTHNCCAYSTGWLHVISTVFFNGNLIRMLGTGAV